MTAPVALGVAVPLGVPADDGVMVDVPEGLAPTEIVAVGVPIMDCDTVAEGETEDEAEAVTLPVREPLAVMLAVPDRDTVRVPLPVRD